MEKKYNLVTMVTEDEINSSIKNLASKLSKEYENDQLIIIAELSGSFVFIADLIRELTMDVKLKFVTQTGKNNDWETLKLDFGDDFNLKDNNVLIVTGILDDGKKVKHIYDMAMKDKPKNIDIVTLVEKENKERKLDLEYSALFKLDNSFFVGYGHTWHNSYRGLKGIYKLVEEVE